MYLDIIDKLANCVCRNSMNISTNTSEGVDEHLDPFTNLRFGVHSQSGVNNGDVNLVKSG